MFNKYKRNYQEKKQIYSIVDFVTKSDNFKEKTETAILQLSDYDGKNVLILDIINLPKNNNFVNTFRKYFLGKYLLDMV